MAIKKSELYSKLWESCNVLRGGMDAGQFKDYVLTLMFLKYISDKAKIEKYAVTVVPEGSRFDDIIALKNTKDIGSKINSIIEEVTKVNPDLEGVITVADFNDDVKLGRGKDKIDLLTKLVSIFEGMDFSNQKAEDDDLLGDAYEYLMGMFASESGRSKGQFYTPSEVSIILSKVLGIDEDSKRSQTAYDPTAGSGSLLLKLYSEAPNGLSVVGQEMDNSTRALAVMNMILHGVEDARIAQGNTLSSPEWLDSEGQLEQFDFISANPPFSVDSWKNGLTPESDIFDRFELGVPPEKNGDYAFLQHILKSLKDTGRAAVVLPHGVLFRGNSEAVIRENMLKKGYIKGVIGLPANLFYGTGIPACILILDKQDSSSREGVFFIDASKGFVKEGNKNRLRSQDIRKVVDAFNLSKELPGFSRFVSLDEIEANDFNLNIPRYIDSGSKGYEHSLEAHLKGGIPNKDIEALALYWEALPNLKEELFEVDREGFSRLKVEPSKVKDVILNHPEFKEFSTKALAPFESWVESSFSNVDQGINPKHFIKEVSKDLLDAYDQTPLIDKYDIYQVLMSYWSEELQDDIYLISKEGWEIGRKVEKVVARKEASFSIGNQHFKAEVLPPSILANSSIHLSLEQGAVLRAQESLDSTLAELEALIEEHGVEDGLLFEALNDQGRITKTSAASRLKESSEIEEQEVLRECIALFDRVTKLRRESRETLDELNKKVLKMYQELHLQDIKELIVTNKWSNTLIKKAYSVIEGVTQSLVNEAQEMGLRYEKPLPTIEREVKTLKAKVNEHLKAMGIDV